MAVATDVDAHPIGLVRDFKQAHELCFLLEQVKKAPQLPQVVREIAHRQQVAFACHHHGVLLRIRLAAQLDRLQHEGGNFTAQALDLGAQAVAHFGQRQARVMGVEKVGGFLQSALLQFGLGVDDVVLHLAIGRDQNHQHAPLRQAEKFDVPKHAGALGHPHHPDEMRQAGEQLRRLVDHLPRLFALQGGWGHGIDGLHVVAAGGEHGVDEQAVAARGGHPAGRGVRAGDQAQLFQVAHHVAHGGGRQLQPGRAREGARTHRLAVGNVAFYQGFE